MKLNDATRRELPALVGLVKVLASREMTEANAPQVLRERSESVPEL
jgi:hypothetical protein